MKTLAHPPARAARFQLRIQDFYVLAALNFIGTAVLLYFEPNPGPQPIILVWLGVLLWWLAALVFRPGKLGEGSERMVSTFVRLAAVLIVLCVGLGGVAAMVIPNCVHPRSASNVSAAVGVCKTFAAAEDTFKRVDYDGNGVLEYAKSFKELYGNGLINLVDKKTVEAEWGPNPTPRNGYLFKVLKSQGPGAPGGSKRYVDARGMMTGGYALLAFPAEYETGYCCFIISSTAGLYQKDLGPDTDRIAPRIHTFDPTGWIASE